MKRINLLSLEKSIFISVLGVFVGNMVLYLSTKTLLALFAITAFILAILIALKFPEIAFALFLTAGIYKGDSMLASLPQFFDLTVFFQLLTAVGITYRIIKRQLKIVVPQIEIFIPYLVLLILSTVSLFYTTAPIYGTDKFLKLLIFTSFAFFLPSILFQNEKHFQNYFWVFIILSLFIFFYLLSSKGLNSSEYGYVATKTLGSKHIAIGRNFGQTIIFLIFFFLLIHKNIIQRLLILFLSGISLFGLLSTGGRGPTSALVISTLFIIFTIYFKRNFFKSILKSELKIRNSIIILIMLSICITYYTSDFFSSTFNRIQSMDSIELLKSEYRWDLYNSAIRAMKDKYTILTGLGIGGFSMYYSPYTEMKEIYPHNILLEIGSELGIFCLIAFIIILFQTFKFAFSNTFKSKMDVHFFISITLLASFIFMLVNSMFSGDINDNRNLFVIIGMIFSFNKMINAQ